jgi:ubiquinone/menaquinone biosynthesis C-methylase UbiE
VATIVLALQNIENLQGTLSEIARVLKPGGRLVFVLNHPAFRIPQRSDWGWDDKNATQYRRIDSYISDDRVKIDMTPGEKDDKKKKFTVSFHRPLQVYFKAMNKAGLAVTRLEEWVSHKKSQEGPRAAEEDRMRKEIPLFVCVECRK